jgi:hypothetical protein
MPGLLSQLPTITAAKTKRISSYDRSGGNADRIQIAPNETVTIADITGPGVIRHIWITVFHPDPMYRRNMVLRIYWNDARYPSVACPLGDFFGQGWGENYNYAALPLCAAPQDGNALNSYFPMPFTSHARIEIENESTQSCNAFYYYIDYEETSVLPEHGYFHAFWNRSVNHPPQGAESEWRMFNVACYNLTDEYNHVIVDAKGKGQYAGVNYYVESPTPLWYGEGDDMWFIDGEPWPPSLHGTGTEDYFNTAWGPKEHYLHPYFGAARINEGESDWLGRTHVYRFHLDDPIYFSSSLRGSIETGHADCLTTDVVTVAYWYQDRCRRMPKLPPAEKRQNMPRITAYHIHRWREAFRELHGRNDVWGTEQLPADVCKKIAARIRQAPLSTPASRKAAKKELKKQEEMLNRRRGKKKVNK